MNTDGNNATGYGVTIQRAQPNAAGLVWAVKGVRALTAAENGGNHNVYGDAYDLDGREMRGSTAIRMAWDWNGRHGDERADPAPLDKPAPEHMTNIALGKGQIARVWLEGDGVPSDVVLGLHTDHERQEGEGEGNSRFHRSFAVTWCKVRAAAEPPPVTQPPQPEQPPAPIQPSLPDDERAAIANRMQQIAARMAAGAQEMNGAAIDLQHLATAVLAAGLARG